MRGRVREIAVGLWMGFLACSCRAGIPPEIVVRAKQATALVEVAVQDGAAEGSAFCIDSAGVFITNAHVVAPLELGEKLTLVLRSGEKDQKIVPAYVVALDKAFDLAILRTDVLLDLKPLALGSTDQLIETMPVTAFGYPFGSELALKSGEYPNISVSTGHITALRKIKGELAAIQLDAALNPGNSGGPILNDRGEVIAIVQEGIPGSGVNLAIPIPTLRSLLKRSQVLFLPPARPREHLREKQEFRIQLLTPPRSGGEVTVSLTLSADAGDHRSFHASSRDGRTFTVLAPLLPSPANSSRPLPSDIAYHVVASQDGSLLGDLTGKISLAPGSAASTRKVPVAKQPGKGYPEYDEILVCCQESNDIRRFDVQTGAYLGDFAVGNGLKEPQDMLWGPDGNLYVSSGYMCSVLRFNGKTGQFIDAFVPGHSAGLENPHDMAWGPDGNLYVSSHGSREVKRYNGKTGVFIDNFISRGSGGLDRPAGLRFGPDGNLYVASQENHLIKRYNGQTGAFLGDFAGGSGLRGPASIEFGPDGDLYVCSWDSSEIKRFNGKTGTFVGNLVMSKSGGLEGPYGMLFAPDGRLYVGGKSNTVKRYDGQTGAFQDDFIGGNNMNYPRSMLYRRKAALTSNAVQPN